MKASTNTKSPAARVWNNDTAVGLLFHLAAMLGGFILAHAPVLSNMLPFGVALAGGVKRKYLAAATAGATAGYLLNVSGGGFYYIAALFAIVAIRAILGGGSRITEAPFFLSLLTLLSIGITGTAVSMAYGSSLLLRIGEAAMAGAAAYFIAVAARTDFGRASGLDIRETMSLVFFVSVILLSLYRVDLLGLSPGRIFAVLVILSAARYGQAAYGAVSGTIISFTLAVSGGKCFDVSPVFAFSGLMCGLFSGLGSLGIMAAYLGTTLISSLIVGKTELIAASFFEALIGSGLFLLIPKKLGGYLGALLSPPTEISRLDSVKGALIMRLEFASGALRDVFETVEDVANRLGAIHRPDFEKTLAKIEEDVCVGCSLRKHCWETAREITAEDALGTWNRSKDTNAHFDDTQEKASAHNCLRQSQFERSVRTHCSEYESRRAAELRISEVRGVINDQFEGISDMLSDLSEEFKYEVRHDAAAAENMILTMKNLGFHAVNCIAARDKFGRLSADIHIKGAADHAINKMEIMRALSLAVGRDFDTPSVSTGGDEAFLFITEKPVYSVEIGVAQLPESKGKLCGDSCKYFSDGRGRFIMLLSDGMGTGGRAAVDSAMVSGLMGRMLRSGFGYDCALKIVNSSMLFKSTDESLSTVDIAAIDLFTGECELLKAGAAPTLVRRSGKVGKAESNSLPPGILREVAFDKAKVSLKREDIVVMVSDGATTEGTEWISAMMADWTVGSAQQLADEIALAARRRRADGHSDDITVMAAILKQKS